MKLSEMWIYMKKFYKMVHVEHPTTLFFVIIGGLAKATGPFISLLYSAKVLDALLTFNITLAKEQVLILLVSVFACGCIDRGCAKVIEVISSSSDYSVWKQTANKAYVMEYEELERTETMDKIHRIRSGVLGSGGVGNQILLSYSLASCLFSIVFSLIYTIQLFVQSWGKPVFRVYTVVLIILFVGLMKIISWIQKKVMEHEVKANRENEHANSLYVHVVSDTLDVQNGKDIRLYRMKKMIQKFYTYWIGKEKRLFLEHGDLEAKHNAIVSFSTQIFAGFVYVYLGISVLQGLVSIGNILLYAGCITRVSGDINEAIRSYNRLAYRFGYLSGFEEFINSPNMHYDGTLPVEKRDDYDYEFEFKNVSFKYPNTDNYVLKNINLKLDVNKRLAIVGQNGAGKTTLIKLLCRLYEPTEGEILLNGINIEKYDYEEYTDIFSVVFQDFRLFPLPLDENIAGSNQVDEARCLEVIEQVGLTETVMNWPDKQHTRLYKNLGDGVNVSGGEAQKIAIARALYKDAPFIIMDEPTAALDPLAEAEVYENFNAMIHEKTAIFISHRMSSCKFCDEIIVFENGEITQKGNHDSLVKEEGLYRQLWNAQAQYYTRI